MENDFRINEINAKESVTFHNEENWRDVRKKQKLVRQQKQSETVWCEMETLVVVLSLKVRKGSNEDWISPLVSFIGVKNVKGVSRIWGKRMEIKVAEINAPLNLMKRKLISATQFKNGNALPLLSLASTGNP